MDARERGRVQARGDLIEAIVRLGYPEEFGEVIARMLGTESTMRRMAGYVRGARPGSPEEIADEAIAIAEQRDRWVERKKSAYYQAGITAFYNRPREGDE